MHPLISLLSLLITVSAQDVELPSRPTVASLSMYGTGCPIGGGGIATGADRGTPIFSFPQWTMDLATEGEADKFCVMDFQLEHGPPGYQVRLAAISVWGDAEVADATLNVRVATSLGGEEAGGFDVALLTDTQGEMMAFEGRTEVLPVTWSACVDEDGAVPLIRLNTTVYFEGEGEGAVGVLGTEGAAVEDAFRVHFETAWRECE